MAHGSQDVAKSRWQRAKELASVLMVMGVYSAHIWVDLVLLCGTTWTLSALLGVPQLHCVAAVVAIASGWLLWDWKTPYRGGRRWWKGGEEPVPFVFARYLSTFFSLKVVKAFPEPFDATKNYIMDIHPHGILTAPIVAACYGGQFHAAFPGATFYGSTHPIGFIWPLARELYMRLGVIAANSESFGHVLRERRGGTVVLLWSASHNEMRRLRPDRFPVYLKRRGFCRVALREGSYLLPTIIFGENLNYSYPLTGLQDWIHRMFGFHLSIPIGRGLFQKYFGLMPHSVPSMIVVGAPIVVEKTPDATDEQVEELHRKFVAAIRTLYEDYSAQYSKDVLPLVIET